MEIREFVLELKAIDKDLDIIPNEKIDGLGGIYYQGQFLTGCPSKLIFDHPSEGYGVELPNGTYVKHRGRIDLIEIVKGELGRIKTDPDYADATFGRGKYSPDALK